MDIFSMDWFNSSSKDSDSQKGPKKNTDNHFFKAQKDSRANNQYYDLAKARDNWRNMAFMLGFICVLFLGAYLWLSMQSEIKPYVYHEDASGELIAMGQAEPSNIGGKQQVRAHIFKVIDHLRTVHEHEELMTQRLQKVFRNYLGSSASSYLNQYFSDSGNDPRNLARSSSRSINVQGIVETGSQGKQWKVRWIETTRTGGIKQKRAWEAFLSIDFKPLESREHARVNPLGLVVKDISWGPISPSTENN